jgi:triacylglycerol esterase/lipase EstA (alpha/beta hydrolase family)
MKKLRSAGHPYIAVNLEPVFGSIDDYLPIIEAAVARLEAATGLAPMVVAHSMGGLACRKWWAGQELSRVHRLITIGTPHRGTRLARYALSLNARQMRDDSKWLMSSFRGEDGRSHRRTTCFWSRCDNIVYPATNAMLAGATNQELPGIAHVQMVDEPAVFVETMRLLDLPTEDDGTAGSSGTSGHRLPARPS